MRAELLFPGGVGPEAVTEVGSEHFKALRADLELDSIIAVMSDGDKQLAEGIVATLAGSTRTDTETVHHRQAVLGDALANPEQFAALHRLAVKGAGATARSGRGLLADWTTAIATQAINTLIEQVAVLGDLRDVLAAGRWASATMRDLAEQAQRELDRDYLAILAGTVAALRPGATLVAGASLGWGNESSQFVLRRADREQARRWPRLPRSDRDTIRFDDRDEGASRALAALRDEVTGPAAGVLAAAAGNIGRFLADLAEQTALYVGALNLAGEMAARGVASTVPELVEGDRGLGCFTELVDLAMALSCDGPVVANTVAADQARAIIVTGANQGGKSTFLRSLGQAQLMAQAGLQVAASQWSGSPAAGLFTHFTREEDRSMRSGRLDDELSRLDGIVAELRPRAMVLLNESLSSTNEREGSALAGQVVGALTEAGVRVAYVTHLYEFAAAAAAQPGYLMLRASRNDDGSRSYRLEEGAPTQTSHGMDLYDQIIGASS